MLQLDENLLQILKQNSNAIQLKVECGDLTFTSDDIINLTITDKLTSSGTYVIGQAPSRTLTLELEGNQEVAVDAYDTTTITSTDTGEEVEIANDDEEEIDSSIEDDGVFGTTAEEELTEEEANSFAIDNRDFPEDWTANPLIVKIGFNSTPLDETDRDTIISAAKAEAPTDTTLDNVEMIDNEKDEAAEIISFDELVAETEAAGSQDTTIDYTYITLGTFYVCDSQDVSTDEETITLVAYDKLYQLKDTQFTTALTYPCGLSELINEIQSTYSITWKGTIPSITVDTKPSGTFREVMFKLALLCGANVGVEPEGNFEFIWPTKVDYSLNSDNYDNIDLSDDYSLISELRLISELNDNYSVYRYGDNTGKTFTVYSDFISSQEQVDTLCGLAKFPLYYLPFTLNCPIYPQLEIGDIITVKDTNNIDRELLIADLEITLSSDGFYEVFSCAEPTSAALGAAGQFTQYIHALKSDVIDTNLLLAKKVDADEVDTKILNANNAMLENIQSTYATIKSLEATDAKIDTISADVVKTSQLDAVKADIQSAVVDSLGTTFLKTSELASEIGKIDTAFITDGMVKGLSASKLISGTIYTDKINIQSSENDESLRISGSLIQMKDETGTARALLGKNSDGDYNFTIYDADGTTVLFNATGLGANTVDDEQIVQGIDAGKLDVQSIYNTINTDANADDLSNTLLASKIKLDGEDATLDAKFGSLSNDVANLTEVSVDTTTFKLYQAEIADTYQKKANLAADVNGLILQYDNSKGYGNSIDNLQTFNSNYFKVDGDAGTFTISNNGTANASIVMGTDKVSFINAQGDETAYFGDDGFKTSTGIISDFTGAVLQLGEFKFEYRDNGNLDFKHI